MLVRQERREFGELVARDHFFNLLHSFSASRLFSLLVTSLTTLFLWVGLSQVMYSQRTSSNAVHAALLVWCCQPDDMFL